MAAISPQVDHKIPYSVSGSRNASSDSDKDIIHAILIQHKDKISEIHVGNCRGVDAIVAQWCHSNEIIYTVYTAKWSLYGVRAGPIRNKELVEKSAQLLAFPGPQSKGTVSAINLAKHYHANEPIITQVSS